MMPFVTGRAGVVQTHLCNGASRIWMNDSSENFSSCKYHVEKVKIEKKCAKIYGEGIRCCMRGCRVCVCVWLAQLVPLTRHANENHINVELRRLLAKPTHLQYTEDNCAIFLHSINTARVSFGGSMGNSAFEVVTVRYMRLVCVCVCVQV